MVKFFLGDNRRPPARSKNIATSVKFAASLNFRYPQGSAGADIFLCFPAELVRTSRFVELDEFSEPRHCPRPGGNLLRSLAAGMRSAVRGSRSYVSFGTICSNRLAGPMSLMSLLWPTIFLLTPSQEKRRPESGRR
jgi:hypothetical protein